MMSLHDSRKKIILVGLDEQVSSFVMLSQMDIAPITVCSLEELDEITNINPSHVRGVIIGDQIKGISIDLIKTLFKENEMVIIRKNGEKHEDGSFIFPSESDSIQEKIQIWMSEEDTERYVPVYFPFVTAHDVYDFDLFTHLKLNNKFVLFKGKGSAWSEKKLNSMPKTDFLFVREREEALYNRYVAQFLHSEKDDSLSEVSYQVISNLLGNVIKNSCNSPHAVMAAQIISSYLTFGMQRNWFDELCKYQPDKSLFNEAKVMYTVATLIAIAIESKKIDDIAFAAFFISCSQNTYKGQPLIEAVERFASSINVILPEESVSMIQQFQAVSINPTNEAQDGESFWVLYLACHILEKMKNGNFSGVQFDDFKNHQLYKYFPLEKVRKIL